MRAFHWLVNDKTDVEFRLKMWYTRALCGQPLAVKRCMMQTTLEFEDAVGDHRIPRSEGIDNGGITEYNNLVVTADVNNRIKSNMNAVSFSKLSESVNA